MASIELIKGSNGTGNASVATVQSTRAPLASTIIVDTVQGINTAGFTGSMGTPHTFTDPVTSETITVISEATAVDFTGHVDGSNIEIDTIAPGYTDAGSAVGDIVIIKPTTQYADNLAGTLEESHDDDGTLKDGAVDTASVLADSVVTTAKINDSAVTDTKVAAGFSVQTVSTAYSSTANGTTTVPLDDTIPQNTEGIEFMTQAITPKSATNILVIRASLVLASSISNNNFIIALFQDSTANALAATVCRSPAFTETATQCFIEHRMVAGTTSATTFKIRAGGNGAGTTTFNGVSGTTRLFGAIPKSVITITEYKA